MRSDLPEQGETEKGRGEAKVGDASGIVLKSRQLW
jgi:hypothetical protein